MFGVTGTQGGFEGRQLTMGTCVRGGALADERRRFGYRRVLILFGGVELIIFRAAPWIVVRDILYRT